MARNAVGKSAKVVSLASRSMQRWEGSQNAKQIVKLVEKMRSYGTSVSGGEGGVARIEMDAQRRLRLVLPLPGVGVTTFVLRPQETLGTLLQEVRAEDDKIESLVFFYEDGRRVAHTTTVDDLVKSTLVLEMNGQKHVVKAKKGEAEIVGIGRKELESVIGVDGAGNGPSEAGILTVDDVETLMKRAYFYKIRQRIEHDARKTISVDEFNRWASEFGLSAEDARALLRALHTAAVVQHFEGNAALSKFIFLKPDELLYSVAKSLDLHLLSKADGTNLAALKRVQHQIAPLDAEKQKFDKIAKSHANKLMFALFVYLCFQFGLLADMVWIDFNWDIMEPITYFVTLTTVIGGFSFFIKSKRDYTYPALAQRFAMAKLRKLYISHRFPFKTWASLDAQRTSLQQKIQSSASQSPSAPL